MSKILSMFGIKRNEDDNIPEMILNKDDPAPYYDKDLKVWMIPGQEEEIKKMLAEQKKPPPIGKAKKGEYASTAANAAAATEKVDNSLVNPLKQVPLAKKPGAKMPANRYASILPESSSSNFEKNASEEAAENNIANNKNERFSQNILQENLLRNSETQKQDAAEIKNFNVFKPAAQSAATNVNKNVEEAAGAQISLHEHTDKVKENTFEQINREVKDSNEFDFNNKTSYIKNKNQDNTLYYSVNNTLNLRNLETTNLENINNNYSINNTTMLNHKNNNKKTVNIEEIIEEKKKHLEQEIRKTIEAEFFLTQTELKEKHEEELQELNGEYIYMQELLDNDKAILKENLNKYIEESLSSKLKIDDLSEDLKIKDKEIEHLKSVVEVYKKSQQEQLEEFSTSVNLSTKESEVNDNKNQSENSLDRYNELEDENINLIKEIFKLKKDIANLSLEKSFSEFKAKDQEKISKAIYENFLSKKQILEKTLNESKREIEALIKKNNNFEKELYKMNEISKLNENLKLNIVSVENQLGNLKKTNHANLNLIKDLKAEINKKNEQIKEIENDLLQKMNYSSTKLLQCEKDIKNLNALKLELTRKLENSLAQQESIKKHEKEIYDLNYKIFNFENELKNKIDENERIRLFMKENVSAYFKNELKEKNKNEFIAEIFENINDFYKNINLNFDHLVCLVFKNFQNYINDLKLQITQKDNSQNILAEENSSLNKSLELTNKLNLSLKSENENSKEKQTKLEKTILNLNAEISSKQNEIKELNQKASNFESELNGFKSCKLIEADEVESQNQKNNKLSEEIIELNSKLSDSNQAIKILKEENFAIKFSNEKTRYENESMLSIFNVIKKDLDSFVSNLPATEFNLEMQKSNQDVEQNEKKIEAQVVCKIKILKNLIENFENKNDLINKQIEILKSELERNNNLLEIKQSETEIISKQNKVMHLNLNESSIKANELNRKIEKLENQLEEKSKEIHNLLKTHTGTVSEKVGKLNNLLDESSKAAENKINALKNEFELKLNDLQEEKRRLIKEKDDEISSLRETASKESFENQKHNNNKFAISESYRNNLLQLVNISKAYFRKFEIEEFSFDDFNFEDLSDSDLSKCFNALKKLVERLYIDIEAKEKEIMNLHKTNSAKREEQTLSKGENLTIEQQEIDVLLKTLDEKDKEINDLKQLNSDLEIQLSKLKISLEESKKNHDYLLTNYKSAEKLSYFQNKVSQLREEKAVILQTNSETIKNLTNEINELNNQLNEFKKKELDYLKCNATSNSNSNINANANEASEKSTSNLNKNLNANKKAKPNDNKNNNKAELFFEKEINIDKKQTEKLHVSKRNVFESDEDVKEIKDNEPNKNEVVLKDSKGNSSLDSPNHNSINSAEKTSAQSKKDQGFFTRFIAPIFLTENELNNLNQD